MTEENKNNNSQSDWKKREIGALWRREGKTQKFLSGKVTLGDEFGEEKQVQIFMFSNRFKEKDNQPDFRIYEDTPIDKAGQEEPLPPSSGDSAGNADSGDDLPDILK